MNIVKLQNELRSVPDNVLIGYVQNPTGQVPSYLAVTEMNRRKEMRDNYQQQKPPESSVVEDLAQSMQPPPQPQGVMGLPQGQQMAQAMQPPPEMPVQQMAQGGLSSLPLDDNMFNEENFANGGIVAFGKGGNIDEYGVERPSGATLDDISMEMQQANQLFGVDPEFYKKQAAELKRQRDELSSDKDEAKWMALANLGFGVASAKPEFGKAQNTLSTWGENAAKAGTGLAKDIKDIKAQDRLLQQADMKLTEARNAEARGDSRAAMKAMDDRNNILLNVQLEEAKLKSAEGIADRKAKATVAGKENEINSKIYDKAQKDFAASFPNGAQETVFQSNPGFFQFVKNVYLKNAESYIKNGTMPLIPNEGQLLDMYTKGKKVPSTVNKNSKLSGADSPLAATRPKNIQAIMDKYAPKGSRSKNTQEELDVPWDLAGQGLEED